MTNAPHEVYLDQECGHVAYILTDEYGRSLFAQSDDEMLSMAELLGLMPQDYETLGSSAAYALARSQLTENVLLRFLLSPRQYEDFTYLCLYQQDE